jgi:hypothetical protein
MGVEVQVNETMYREEGPTSGQSNAAAASDELQQQQQQQQQQ